MNEKEALWIQHNIDKYWKEGFMQPGNAQQIAYILESLVKKQKQKEPQFKEELIMTEEKLAEIEDKIDAYWDAGYVEPDVANPVANAAYQMLIEIKRLRGIIEDADTEASLRRHDSFDKINEILSKVNKND